MSRESAPVPSPLISTVRDAFDGRGVDVVTGYCVIRTRVPLDRRPAVAEAVMRANYGLRYGNFEVDYDGGEQCSGVSVLEGESKA